MIEIILTAISSVLWRLGGWSKAKWSGYRDVLIPIMYGIYHIFTCNWIIGLLTCGASNSIRIGYGAYDPEHDDKPSWLAKITKDREGWRIRGIYGFITSFSIGLFPTIYHVYYEHKLISLLGFLLYIVGNVALEIIINKRKTGDTMTELLNGAGRGLVMFLCK